MICGPSVRPSQAKQPVRSARAAAPIRAIIVACASVALLAACGAKRVQPPAVDMAQVRLAGELGGLPPRPDGKPADRPEGSTLEVTALPPEDEAATAGELALQPSRPASALIGLNEEEMRARYGDPTQILEAPPGIRWQYGDGAQGCTVQVFFFMEVATRQMRVLSYEVTGDGDAAQSEQQCLADFTAQTDPERG